MKYCSHCGNEMTDEAAFCSKCGFPAEEKESEEAEVVNDDGKETIRLIARVFMIISCVTVGWSLIPLIWMIPMTVSYWKACEQKRDVSVAFKICTLIFVNTIAGILMLCDSIGD